MDIQWYIWDWENKKTKISLKSEKVLRIKENRHSCIADGHVNWYQLHRLVPIPLSCVGRTHTERQSNTFIQIISALFEERKQCNQLYQGPFFVVLSVLVTCWNYLSVLHLRVFSPSLPWRHTTSTRALALWEDHSREKWKSQNNIPSFLTSAVSGL